MNNKDSNQDKTHPFEILKVIAAITLFGLILSYRYLNNVFQREDIPTSIKSIYEISKPIFFAGCVIYLFWFAWSSRPNQRLPRAKVLEDETIGTTTLTTDNKTTADPYSFNSEANWESQQIKSREYFYLYSLVLLFMGGIFYIIYQSVLPEAQRIWLRDNQLVLSAAVCAITTVIYVYNSFKTLKKRRSPLLFLGGRFLAVPLGLSFIFVLNYYYPQRIFDWAHTPAFVLFGFSAVMMFMIIDDRPR